MSSLHNQIKYGTDLLRAFSRAVGLAEDEEGTVRLSETLTPVIDAWNQPELAFLRNELLLFDRTGTIAAGVGQRSAAQLFNPATSRSLVIAVECRVAIGSDWEIVMTGTALATLARAGGIRRDTRIGGGTGGGRAEVRSATAAYPVDAVAALTMRGENVVFDKPIVLSPGWGIIVAPTADNLASQVSFVWRERPMLPGELRG